MAAGVDEFSTIAGLLQGGGNVALGLACYFIYRAEKRLSRIEKALDYFLHAVGSPPTLKEMRERLRPEPDH